jgi:hypothetical protein
LKDDEPQVAVIKKPSASAESSLKSLSAFSPLAPPSVATAVAALPVSVFSVCFSKMSKHVFSPIYQDISYDIS